MSSEAQKPPAVKSAVQHLYGAAVRCIDVDPAGPGDLPPPGLPGRVGIVVGKLLEAGETLYRVAIFGLGVPLVHERALVAATPCPKRPLPSPECEPHPANGRCVWCGHFVDPERTEIDHG